MSSCPQASDFQPPSSVSACYIAANSTQAVQQLFSQCCTTSHSTTAPSDDKCFLTCSASDGSLDDCFSNGLGCLNPPLSGFDIDSACYGLAASSSPISTGGANSTCSADPAGSSSTPSASSSSASSASVAASKTASASAASTSASGTASPSPTHTGKASARASLSMGAMVVMGLALFGLLA
ncbi:Uu.00g145140.m01.CDS01 [Anthostomella pinea]|uniref:Uu.00g145140.m01.CDS01 n=1 Tax=Anthostomella pinea TaxID=933095 RepID=A0AAI8VR05_9PEZI|nr:Uu.00g145140.m01.CDS01 [Anthostomella pinea]